MPMRVEELPIQATRSPSRRIDIEAGGGASWAVAAHAARQRKRGSNIAPTRDRRAAIVVLGGWVGLAAGPEPRCNARRGAGPGGGGRNRRGPDHGPADVSSSITRKLTPL